MFSPYFKVPGYINNPGHTFSLKHIIGFSDIILSTNRQTWEYSIHTTARVNFIALFSCQEEAKKSHDKLKEDLGVFDQTFSFEELP